MHKTQVPSLGQEDPLEKERTTHSSILAWRIPQAEESGGLLFMGSQESDTTEQVNKNDTTVPERTLLSVFGWRTRLPEFDLLLKLEP